MLLVPAHLIILFHLIVVSFSPSVFLFHCVVSVALALALVFMPGLYSTAYRATFPAFYAVASSLFLLFVWFVCVFFFFVFVFVYRDDVVCWLLSCLFSSVCFPCLPPISGMIWLGSVYLVTTAGFVVDQLM